MTDHWEEGFDSWTPRGAAAAGDDTDVDLDREQLLRLARELAERRRTERDAAGAELEQLKQALRERAEAVAARERELVKLEKGRSRPRADVDKESLLARERAALERAQQLDARERELKSRAAALEAEAAEVRAREEALAAELARAQAQLQESQSEQELARAERAQLEQRSEEARRVEKELAARRIELERLTAHVSEPAAAAVPAGADGALRALEARLDARERDLALVRQGLDAERNALNERDRALRRRELAELRQSFEPPLAPPGFSEGLASFVSSRRRR